MLNTLTSAAESLKERVRNQLVFSIAVAWVVRNFNLVIFFFNIPADWNYERIYSEAEDLFLKNHSDGGWGILGSGILLWTLYLLLVFLGRLGSRLIVLLMDKVKRKVVVSSDYNKSQGAVEVLTKQLEDTRKSYSEAITDRNELTQRIFELERAVTEEEKRGEQRTREELEHHRTAWEKERVELSSFKDGAFLALYELLKGPHYDLIPEYAMGGFAAPNIKYEVSQDYSSFTKDLLRAGLVEKRTVTTNTADGIPYKASLFKDTALGSEFRKFLKISSLRKIEEVAEQRRGEGNE